jgi:hypothetical protein
MAHTEVNAGVCGFVTRIEASSEDGQTVKFSIQTQCPSLKPIETELTEADGFAECFAKIGDSPIYGLAKKYCNTRAVQSRRPLSNQLRLPAASPFPAMRSSRSRLDSKSVCGRFRQLPERVIVN